MFFHVFLLMIAFLINVPLGYLRGNARRFSLTWFIWIHASIPLILSLRHSWHIAGWFSPFLILTAISGQLFGHRLWLQRKESYDR